MMVPKTGLEKQSLLARGKVIKQLYQKPFEQDPKLIVLRRDSPVGTPSDTNGTVIY